MRNPFTFDETRVKRDDTKGYGRVYYETPYGTIEEAVTKLDIAFGASITGSMNAGWYVAIQRLEDAFSALVAGLSAHERLAWMSAAQKEKPDA